MAGRLPGGSRQLAGSTQPNTGTHSARGWQGGENKVNGYTGVVRVLPRFCRQGQPSAECGRQCRMPMGEILGTKKTSLPVLKKLVPHPGPLPVLVRLRLRLPPPREDSFRLRWPATPGQDGEARRRDERGEGEKYYGDGFPGPGVPAPNARQALHPGLSHVGPTALEEPRFSACSGGGGGIKSEP
jgi:hypothetical protein